MDFGLVDTLVSSTSAASAPNNGGGGSFSVNFLKQERGAVNANDEDFKICNSSLRSNGYGSADGHQQMLCFSSPSPVSSPYYHQTSYGFGSNGPQGGFLSGLRGPFTPSQWMELEHQALIYKYITANVPIPSYLLHPIRKAFESVGFSSFAGMRSNALGWGAFHLGFASTDPEPGRCRRTDGKKWRCSRDAVVDQKYCERHMNRGRHRSRKPVEGQSGQPATKTSGGKPTPIAASSAPAASVGGASTGVVLSHPSGIPNINKSVADKDKADVPRQQAKGLEDNHRFSATNPHPYGESSFGLVCSDSLLNPLNRSSSLINNKNYNTSDNNLPDHGNKSHDHNHHPLRQFMDEWPENQPDRTQISISMASAASPPRHSRELEMGLGVGPAAKRTSHRQTEANWVPISWEPSMGGPLGEALHTAGECNSTKPLNLIGTWDSNSPRLASSPTGVLQRGPFGSLSSSSAGSSPRAGLCNGLIGSSLMNPSLPSL